MGARRGLVAAAALALVGALRAAPQVPNPAQGPQDSSVPRMRVPRRPEHVPAPQIDGVLDDAAWAAAAPLGELSQVEPIQGALPSERTEVRLLYDSDALYIHILCLDREPALIRATQMKRDAELDPDDRVEILIDSIFDQRNAFWFQIGAAGSKGDALISKNGSNFNKQWDGIWHGRARLSERGWEAELAIPTATLNFDPASDRWGFNLRRFIRRRTEEVRWASPLQSVPFFWVSNAGVLAGFEGLSQGLGLEFSPFVVASAGRDHSADVGNDDVEAGIDAIWRITPDSKLTLSYNTDFAETEVDQRQINLTRFPLLFPEKRKFFLEDSGAFYFGYGGNGGNQQEVIPFFSRRIGLDDDGNEVPLLGAAKYTAQTEDFTLGLLGAQLESSASSDGAELFSGRYSQNVLARSDVGLIWTHGDPQTGASADTVGIDFNYRTEEFLDDRNLNVSTWLVGTSGDDEAGDEQQGLGYSANVSYPNNEVQLSARATHIDAEFDPKLGFVRRAGTKAYVADLAWEPRLNGAYIRQLEFALEPELVTDTGNGFESASIELQPFGVEFESGDESGIELRWNQEDLSEDFEITDDVTIPVGDYEYLRGNVFLRTSDKRPLSLELELGTGGFFDGQRNDAEVELQLRASRYVLLGLAYELNDVDLPDGDFVVNVGSLELTLLASPDLSWTQFLQYDDVSQTLGLNSRLWWILQPGSSAYLVLNQGWDRSSEAFVPLQTELTFKLGYTLRL